ncbi:Pho80p, partial [Ascoidea rubescens DSM 1968]
MSNIPHSTQLRKKLPSNFKDCSQDDLLIMISRMLISLINMNDSLPLPSSQNLTRFHSRAPPLISVYDYLNRLTKYNSLENSILLTSIYYIDLLTSVYPNFNLNSLTVHRFLLTAITIGSKGLCDFFCTNKHYAKIGGVTINELNILEIEFLSKLDWKVVPKNI